MRELLQGEHFILMIDDERRMVRRTRTGRPFASVSAAEAAWEEMLQAIDTIERAKHTLFIDLRATQPRDDAAYESLVERNLPRLFAGFRRSAILVKTHAGRLQILRMHKDTPRVQAFVDETAALAYLTSNERS